MNPAPPTTFQNIALTVNWIVVGWFVVSLLVGSRRTPYGWAAGTVVVTATSTSAGKGA